MNVLLINGSPRKNGCTYTALAEVAKSLETNGIETEILHIGAKPVGGCVNCGACKKTGRCAFSDAPVNEAAEKLRAADGLVVGSPVYYASPNGGMIGFLDRLFYSAGGSFANKPAAAVVSARRGGTTASLDVLQKYFVICNMPVVPSQYWPMVHGNSPEEVQKDGEGLQVMRLLGANMAWMIRCFDAGRKAGIEPPAREPRIATNFIR